jgi:hypothetical protein
MSPQTQVSAADGADVAETEHGVLFSAASARFPGVDAIPGRAIGNASHLSFSAIEIF